MDEITIDEVNPSEYDAIIAGGGAGGLLTALSLTSEDMNVLVIEKQRHLGGVWHGYHVDGYRVDNGLHVITRVKRGAFTEFLREHLDPPPEFVLHDGWFFRVHDKVGTIPTSVGETLRWPLTPLRGRLTLARIGAKIKTMGLEEMKEYKDISFQEFMEKHNADNQVILDVMESAIYMAAGVPVEEASAYEALRTLKDTDKETSKLESLKKLLFGSDEYDEGYVIGGMLGIRQRVTDNIRGNYVLDTPVERIRIQDGKVRGIVAGGRNIKHERIVSNIPLWSMPNIVDTDDEHIHNYFQRWSDFRVTEGMTLWLGLDEVVIGDRKSRVIVHPRPATWIVSISSFDPSCAPEGKELLGLATIVIDDSPEELVERVKTDILAEYFPDVLDHIEMEHMQSSYATRAALIPGQTDLDRPGPRTPAKGLYIVGTDTAGSGVGLQQASRSAQGVKTALLDDL
ncbi:MAG: NAD(P)/FAD-dependent oxidoreductase [Candidatus Thorarchaeota archaeon]|nr:NAD(P)/FAD-dependent oxidoreductase [Candidatus Thorarchaeota archaeon]